ncbi:hypothetical protein K4K61_002931 [Colletotrichum sp. SAR11_59]|uniref:Secreted protein n=1 Tax=Colletotrichum asianum TaxID=702518 RepID=A0A8H3ZSB8_9PEZI|nr:hypothetical protein GQ607_008395 [Colletotrichum asianum]KAI8308118.1 hypothetical protein K4K61_002931 [Colletotrichum sp. SAR11_59]
MKLITSTTLAILALSAVSAYMCNCFNRERPNIQVALQFCEPGSGTTRCWDKATNSQACILNKPITQADCDAHYSPKGDWIASCQHWTGGCPKGMAQM